MMTRKETYRLDPDRIIDGELYDGAYFDVILIQRADPETGETRYHIDADDLAYILGVVVTTNANTDELISCQVGATRLDADEARHAGFEPRRGGGGAVWLLPDGSIHSTFKDGWDEKVARMICDYVD